MDKRAMREAVTRCVAHFGTKILTDKNKFKAAILDFLPSYAYKEERDWLFFSVDMLDIGSVLVQVSPVNYPNFYRNAHEKLQKRGINAETADAILQAFTGALKWGVPPLWTEGGGGGNSGGGQPPCLHSDIDYVSRRCRQCNEKLYGIFDASTYLAYDSLDKDESGDVLLKLGDYSGTLVLPERLRGIGDYALNKRQGLREVIFPSALTSIVRFAFEGCSSLTSLDLPVFLRRIGEFAFADCAYLRSVILPGSLRTIEKGAFSGCSKLKLNVPPSVTSIGAEAFFGVPQVIYDGPASGAPWGAAECRRNSSPGPLNNPLPPSPPPASPAPPAPLPPAPPVQPPPAPPSPPPPPGGGQPKGSPNIANILVAVFVVGIIAVLFFVSLNKNSSSSAPQPPVQSVAVNNSHEDPAASLRAEYENKQVGEYFEFGSYPQGSNGEVEPIVWRVLRRDSDSLLVISKYGLDAKPYNEELKKSITWSECSLRRWLNGEFLQKAFTEREQSLIKVSSLSNNSGPATDDRIFLLSKDEAEELFASDDDRCTKPTAYAIENYAFAENGGVYAGNTWWWLRSRDLSDSDAADVYAGGNIYDSNVDSASAAVRPAFRIEL